MINLKKWHIIIPARLASTRLYEKPLADLLGRPLILRVYDRIQQLEVHGAKVTIATDHEKVYNCCHTMGAPIQMTNPNHESGTDRCAEVAASSQHEFILNVQGDEPFVNLDDLIALMTFMQQQPESTIGTLVYRNHSLQDMENPNIVKVVKNTNNEALYFSRATIPFKRDNQTKFDGFWQHQGIYAYRRVTLEKFCTLKPGYLEQIEKLEQLRALENGISIFVLTAKNPSIGIDTPEDLEKARNKLAENLK